MRRLGPRGRSLAFRCEGKGPPLLVFHGFTGSNASFRELAEALSPSFRLYLFDLLGHGASDAPRVPAHYRLAELAGTVATLFAEEGLTQADVLGYSLGGRLALTFALLFPARVRRLVLESASPGIEDEAERSARRQQDEAFATLLEQEGVAAFVERWERLPLFAGHARLPERRRAEERAIRLAQSAHGLAASLRGSGQGVEAPLWAELPRLRCPVLLVVGEEDRRYRALAERMRRAIPRVRLEVVPRTGHTVHLEAPSAFVRIVAAFLLEEGL
jgi:2-succinyl-6-hydroxy-2,4-cyclohexadiene-1-carboxylate synthase